MSFLEICWQHNLSFKVNKIVDHSNWENELFILISRKWALNFQKTPKICKCILLLEKQCLFNQERKVSYNSTFIEFVFDIPALSVDVICISWETCYWKVCFQFCGQIFLNKCGGYFFILKNPLLNIFFLFLLCLKKFFFLFFCVEKLTSQISWWKLRNKYSFMLFWN